MAKKKINLVKKPREICTFCGFPLIDGFLLSEEDGEKFCKADCVRKYYFSEKTGPPMLFVDGACKG